MMRCRRRCALRVEMDTRSTPPRAERYSRPPRPPPAFPRAWRPPGGQGGRGPDLAQANCGPRKKWRVESTRVAHHRLVCRPAQISSASPAAALGFGFFLAFFFFFFFFDAPSSTSLASGMPAHCFFGGSEQYSTRASHPTAECEQQTERASIAGSGSSIVSPGSVANCERASARTGCIRVGIGTEQPTLLSLAANGGLLAHGCVPTVRRRQELQRLDICGERHPCEEDAVRHEPRHLLPVLRVRVCRLDVRTRVVPLDVPDATAHVPAPFRYDDQYALCSDQNGAALDTEEAVGEISSQRFTQLLKMFVGAGTRPRRGRRRSRYTSLSCHSRCTPRLSASS
jgi:hypothetical protein